MRIYSETISAFLKKMHGMSRDILSQEMHLKVLRERFQVGKYLYPLRFAAFERTRELGFFESDTYLIGLHKSLVYCHDEIFLKNILRHELAHYYAFIHFGKSIADHGSEFHEICKSFGWGEEVYAAKTTLPEATTSSPDEIVSKIKKLLSLASSENEHEAELATLKANQLLLKHNLSSLNIENDSTEVCVLRVLEAKRNSVKLSAISSILKTFLVFPVLNYAKGKVYLEITGSRSNVEVGQYVAHFLDQELERLWLKEKTALSSHASHAFYLGVAQGYLEKIKKVQASFSSAESQALTLIEDQLQLSLKSIYRRMGTSSSHIRPDKEAKNKGIQAGKNLSIRPSVRDQKNLFLN